MKNYWLGLAAILFLATAHAASADSADSMDVLDVPAMDVPARPLEGLLHKTVIGGQLATKNTRAAPFTVQLMVLYPGSNFGSSCTGVIIANDMILTAAHCFQAPNATVRVRFGLGGENGFTHTIYSRQYRTIALNQLELGKDDGDGPDSPAPNAPPLPPSEKPLEPTHKTPWVNGYYTYNENMERLYMKELRAREGFKNSYTDHAQWAGKFADMALVKIPSLPPGYKPIQIFWGRLHFNQDAYVVGYGINSRHQAQQNDALKWAKLSLVGFLKVPNERLPRGWEVARPDGGDQRFCQGDSGGPTMVYSNGEMKLLGIQIFSIMGCAGGGWITSPQFYKARLLKAIETLRKTTEA